MEWIKNKIRKWLGVDKEPVFMGVDAHMKGGTCIVVASQLHDGYMKILDVQFGSFRELQSFIKEVQQRHGIPDERVFLDLPYIDHLNTWKYR